MKRMTVFAAAVLGLVIALGSAPANAAVLGDREVDPQVAAMLEEVPGGVIVDSTHAVWPELGMELTVATASGFSARAVQNCATARICAYSGYSLSGSALTFTACGVLAIPSSFSVKSAANARSTGYAQARNGTTVLGTVYAGSWSNLSGTVTNIRCVL
ncbi:hypothetical protein [Microbacterium sp. MYb66]|jgi:hypothetical protein|uniref:hypothetical protein n=1 Tax=Microbacterium sp. MYb66 TaxID=1848692 RepID=UPI000CFE744E|nr:hypothetical protein [Microbacterium sp. MYb66]PRA79962.1 hypothetical protein CQ045_12905 [Microbacterium sp. MYb66]